MTAMVCVLLGLQLSEEIFGFQTRQQFLCLEKTAAKKQGIWWKGTKSKRWDICWDIYIYTYTYIGYWMILIGILACLKLEIVEAAWKCQNDPKCISRLLLVLGQLPRGATPGRHGLVAKGPSSPAFAELPGSDVLCNVVGEPKSCKHIRVVYCEYGILK